MKKITKILRALCLVMVLSVAGLALTACEEEDNSDPAHTIYFYNTMGSSLQDALKASIKEFETKFPGWTVQSSQIGNYDDVRSAIITDLQGGTQPDLAYCYPDHVAQYLVTGKVVNMNKYINNTNKLNVTVLDGEEWVSKEFGTIGYSAEEVADFVSGYYKEGLASNFANYSKYGYEANDILTLPFQKSTEVLYYNADALEELGKEVPTTWDELWEVCAAAKAKWPKVTPLGYDSESNWFITMCEQNGWGYTSASEPHYLFNNANTQAWLTQLAEYYSKGYFTTQEIYGSYSSNLFVKGVEEGGTIFSIGSSGGASHQATDAFEWGVAPIPGSKLADGSVNYAAISQGPSLVMFDTSADNAAEKQLMTWEFVKILLDPEFQMKFAGVSGYMPARLSTYDIPEYKDDLADTSLITAVTCNVARGITDRYFTSPAFVGSSTARDQVGVALRYVITGSKSAASALAEAARKCGA